MHFFSTCASKLIADFVAYLPQKSSSIIFMTSFQHWSFRQQIFIWTWMNLTGLYEITKFWTNSGCPWNPDMISKKWKMFLYNNASLEKTKFKIALSKQLEINQFIDQQQISSCKQISREVVFIEMYNNSKLHANIVAKMYIHSRKWSV